MSAKKYVTIDDINNDRSGISMLTAIDFVYVLNKHNKKERKVLCVCSCGYIKTMSVWQTIKNVSCGCYNKSLTQGRAMSLDQIISKMPPSSCLKVLELAGYSTDKRGRRQGLVKCECICGKIKTLQIRHVLHGTKSCGCIRMENVLKAVTKYPNANQRILSSYWAMMSRCNNPNNHAYHLYGGNGVTICEEWMNDYFSFEKWSLENGWRKGLFIDKDIIGNGKLYSPDTCKWATPKENCWAKSNSIIFFYEGEYLCLSEICERKGVKRSTIYTRIRLGMDFNIAINEPIKDKNLNLLYNRKNKKNGKK